MQYILRKTIELYESMSEQFFSGAGEMICEVHKWYYSLSSYENWP